MHRDIGLSAEDIMARTKQKPALDWAVTVRLPHELESRVKDLASERLVPPAVALRQLVKERLDELQRAEDAWLYTPEQLNRQADARASARAGRTVALSRDDLGRLQTLDDDALDDEIDRLRVRAEQADSTSPRDA
jgi:predicted DNA-binding protein